MRNSSNLPNKSEGYVIAKYIRLSLDDAISDSLSIPNQRALLDKHIDSLEIPDPEILEFVDNGFTGTNLERPALQEMLDLVQCGRINCILVKDFSRFARNEIESSYYIEQVFPVYRIRFIAVGDRYDSANYRDGMGGIEVAFKFLMHEHYSLDLSKKIKSARRVKMKSGENIVANTIYGYQKNMSTGKWEPDKPAADMVKLIFQKALDNVPSVQIRNHLCAAKLPTPREYMNLKRGKDITPRCAWYTTAINAILENEQYIGTYVSGKYERKGVAVNRHTVLDRSEWIIIPDSHPPIISKEDFAAVQNNLGRVKGGVVEKPIAKLLNSENHRERMRMEEGKIINGTPSYGYGRGEDGKWVISEPVAGRVREIFDMTLQGLSCKEIAQKLHDSAYPSPMEHIKLLLGHDFQPEYKWTERNVRSILKNAQYTGAYVSGKVRKDYETGKRYKMRECDWIVIPDKHPAIISSEVFEQVGQLLIERRKRRNMEMNVTHFSGNIIKCGCCGYGLRYSDMANPPRYFCAHTQGLVDAECHKMKISADKLESALMTIIKKQVEVVTGTDDMSVFHKASEGSLKMQDCMNRIEKLSNQRQECYERFLSGEITREAFLSEKEEQTAQIESINSQLNQLRQMERNRDSHSKTVSIAKETMAETATLRDMVAALIEKVLVFPDNRLEVFWKFEDFTKQ